MIPAYVISLAASARREVCAGRLASAGLAFSFFDAVDGRALPEASVSDVVDLDRNRRRFKRGLSRAEIGCYLSHRQIWSQIAAGSAPAALVLEDDAILAPALPAFLAALDDYALDDALIKLDGPRLRPRRLRGPVGPALAGVRLVELITVTPHTTGYVIGRRAAARMLAARQRFFRPVDTDMKFTWEHGVPIIATDPVLVQTDAAADSSIEPDRAALKPRSGAVRLLRNLRYQADFYLRRRWAKSPVHAYQLTRRDGAADD